MSAPSDSPPVAIVGAGAVGRPLAVALEACGYDVAAVLSRTERSARRLASRVDARVGAASFNHLPETVRLVFVCVPDRAIEDVAEALADVDHPWKETIVAHTSGARRADALAALARCGAGTLSFHPLQTFTGEEEASVFRNVVVSLEGADRAVAAGKGVVHALGSRPLVLSAEEKVRYHCAAALASNGLVALMGVVDEILDDLPSPAGTRTMDLVGPLVHRTLENVEAQGPEDALTGPVERGDRGTVDAHLDVLAGDAPQFVPLYVALSTEMLRMAVRQGALAPDEADEMIRALRTASDAAAADDLPPASPL